MYGFTFEQALHMAASFGGGIGRMREICGAACGMFLLAGLERCAVEGADREGKAANYKLVQELAEKFKEECGTIHCSELLGLSKKEPIVATPDARTAQYYAKRPCARMVETAARIWGDFLENEGKLLIRSCFLGCKMKVFLFFLHVFSCFLLILPQFNARQV